MGRDKELRGIVAKTIHQHRLDGFTSRELADAILDQVEGPIRDDQRGFDIRQQVTARDEFRAMVQERRDAMDKAMEAAEGYVQISAAAGAIAALDEVLLLIDQVVVA